MTNTLAILRYPLLEEAGAEGGGGAPAPAPTPAPASEGGAPPAPAPAPAEGGTPAPASGTPEPAAPKTPEYTPEAAAALDAEYSLNPPSADPADPNGKDSKGDTPPAEDYAITLPDNFGGDEAGAMADILTPIARESGLDGKAYGDLFAKSYTAIEEARQRAVWQERFTQSEQLKADWGKDYEANMKTARGYTTFLKEKAGLTDADLAVFQSPKGMRALFAMATAHGERPAAGLNNSHAAEKSWAESVLRDPNHPDHKALYNPSDPRYKEVNDRWTRAMKR